MEPSFYYVTALSNFARGFDRYSRRYCKSGIQESTYPHEFYVLPRSDLSIGARKAGRLLEKLSLRDNRLVAIETRVPSEALHRNPRTGLGLVWPHPFLPVERLHDVEIDGTLRGEISTEDAMADSLSLLGKTFLPFPSLAPRSLSFLPVARACEAACDFCFSKASASFDQKHGRLDWKSVARWIRWSSQRGAERAVITGGGEPALLPWEDLARLIEAIYERFEKIVLITNGHALSKVSEQARLIQLMRMQAAGLTRLAVSRHHWNEDVNASLMHLRTGTEALARTFLENRAQFPRLKLRWICVLQKGGVETSEQVGEYVRWAVRQGVEEICFKELYISTSRESIYHSSVSNRWSAQRQVPLSVVSEWASDRELQPLHRLPWGAPIFSGRVEGKPVRIAAYTEPSLYWERTHGIARSWNVMSDGTCLASLEDKASEVTLPEERL